MGLKKLPLPHGKAQKFHPLYQLGTNYSKILTKSDFSVQHTTENTIPHDFEPSKENVDLKNLNDADKCLDLSLYKILPDDDLETVQLKQGKKN